MARGSVLYWDPFTAFIKHFLNTRVFSFILL